MSQLKVEIKSEETNKILKEIKTMHSSRICKERQEASNTFLTAITYYPEKNVLVGTDAKFMLIWKINDNDLLSSLKNIESISWFKYEENALKQISKPDNLKAIDYKKLIPKFDAYCKLDELDVEAFECIEVEKHLMLLEYACICSRARFNPRIFEQIYKIAKWDTIEFLSSDKSKPIMFKSNSSRLMALIMPLREDKIKTYKKQS